MNKEIWIAIAACACLTMQFAYGQQNSKVNALKQKAVQLLDKLQEIKVY